MFQNLISFPFWFNARPQPVGFYGQQVLWAIIAILIIISIIIAIRAYKESWHIYKKSFDKLKTFCLTNSLISLYLLFVHDQLIPVLRARYWYIIWVIIAGVWLTAIIKDFRRRIARRGEISHNAELKKYIPS